MNELLKAHEEMVKSNALLKLLTTPPMNTHLCINSDPNEEEEYLEFIIPTV